MERIIFRNVIPAVFANRRDIDSEIWGKEMELRRGSLYLIEAASGQGKSTFCSYIAGYRNDFAGSLLFDDKDNKDLKRAFWLCIW